MKKIIFYILIVSLISLSCVSANIKEKCNVEEYETLTSSITYIDRCYIVLSTSDTLYNVPKDLKLNMGESYQFIIHKQILSNCEVLQKDCITALKPKN